MQNKREDTGQIATPNIGEAGEYKVATYWSGDSTTAGVNTGIGKPELH